MVRLDRVHDVFGLAVLAGDVGADQRVAALDLVRERLADVVQERAPLDQRRIEPQLGGHDPGDVAGLDQVLEHVLAVARAVAQAAEQRDQLRVQVGDADLDQRVLRRALAQPLDLGLRLFVDLFDAVRVDPAVEHQLVEREPADLAPDRIKTRQQDRFRGVVDDQVDPGDGLEGPDVATLAADDPALHLVARQVQHADHALRGLLAGDPLDGVDDDVPGAVFGGVAGVVLDVPDQQRRLALGLRLDRLDELGAGGVGGQAGDPFQLAAPRLLAARDGRLAIERARSRARPARPRSG